MANVITIQIEGDQALVFFDMMADIVEGNRAIDDLRFCEEVVLAGIVADMESNMVEVFSENYDSLVDEARKRIESGL